MVCESDDHSIHLMVNCESLRYLSLCFLFTKILVSRVLRRVVEEKCYYWRYCMSVVSKRSPSVVSCFLLS